VRKRFPELLKLDGDYISPLIMAEVIVDLSWMYICDISEE
jgi:hypothetical protein